MTQQQRSAFSTILAIHDLAMLVLEFQCGIYEDVYPLMLRHDVIATTCTNIIADPSNAKSHLMDFHTAFAPWYHLRSDTASSSLRRLLRCNPKLAPLLALYGVFTNTAPLLTGLLQLPQTPSLRWSSIWMDIAASAGHLRALRVLDVVTKTCPFSAMDHAAMNGHLHVVTYLHEHRREGCTESAMDYASANGHLAVVAYLHAHRYEGCTTFAMDWAAEHGHLDVVRFLHENRTEGASPNALADAAINSHLEVVRFLLTYRPSDGCREDAMDRVAGNGHLKIVQLLHEATTCRGWTTSAMDNAAAGGHLEVVQFLHRHRPEGASDAALVRAAEGGHFDVVRFLHEQYTQGDRVAAIDRAVRQGHAQIVGYLQGKRKRESQSLYDTIKRVRLAHWPLFL
ncbi:hypothetical protein DYB36_013354 [Aphanomyces astaci]|uniref:Uncharacterized protein n=1 Tax=Aphanomyces astaci TaxID=112090 RepID=A0A397B2E9_APHAT|nr:hypothetical protein DYB36_013354 [Aphanomyces astaci]